MIDKLKKQVVLGVKWSGFSMGTITTLQFLTLAILARILLPSDFGLMGMIMVIIGFAQAFADIGLSNAIIHRQDVIVSHLSSFFWINILTGIFLFGCIILTRSFVVIYFKQPSLYNYLTITAFIFLITPFGQIFGTLLRKELRFKTLSKIEIAGAVIYSISTISFALAKFGILSLIFGQLIRSLFTVSILFVIFRKKWLPKFHFNIKEIKSYLSFGAFQMGERTVNYLNANIDYIIIGRFLGPEPLGFYRLAYRVITFPLTKLNPVITKVAFPAFSKIQDDNSRMRNGYCKVIKHISTLSFPLLAGMFVVAPEFVSLVFGEKWGPSIIVIQIFCVLGIFKSLGNPIGSVLLAKGRADIGFYWNVFVLLMVSVAVIVGVKWGIVGVAVAILILQVPLFFIIQPIVNKLLDLKLCQYFKAIQSPLICSSIMLAVMIPLKIILKNINMLPQLIICIGTGMIIYIVSYYIIDRAVFIELKSMMKRV